VNAAEPTPQSYGIVEVERSPVVKPGADGGYAVVSALCDVMKALPNIGKDDKSPEGYSYRGIEAITRHVQQLFAEHGVLPVPQAEIVRIVASPAMKDGWQDVIMRVEWTLIGRDGSTISAVTNGVGRDRSDKGANKAQTQSLKYLLIPLLMIADGKDDADSQSYDEGRRSDAEAASTTQVAEFYETLGRLGEDQKAALRAWFGRNKIGKVENSTAENASKAIIKAREFLSAAPVPVEPPPGEGPPAGESEQQPLVEAGS
jgi:hypothetical protein